MQHNNRVEVIKDSMIESINCNFIGDFLCAALGIGDWEDNPCMEKATVKITLKADDEIWFCQKHYKEFNRHRKQHHQTFIFR